MARSNPSGNPAGTSGTASAQELHRFPPTNGTSPRRRRMRAAAWGGQRGRCGGAGRTGPVLVHAGGVTALAVRYPRHFTDLPRVRGSPCAARRRHRRATVIVATGPAEPDGGHHGGPVGPRRHGHRGHPSGGPGSERDTSLERTPCVTAGTEPGWVTYVLGQVPGWVTYRTGSRTGLGVVRRRVAGVTRTRAFGCRNSFGPAPECAGRAPPAPHRCVRSPPIR